MEDYGTLAAHYRDRQEVPHVVILGRSQEPVKKILHLRSKKQAVQVANGIAFVLWKAHPFRIGDPYHRHEESGYWMTIELTKPTERIAHDSD